MKVKLTESDLTNIVKKIIRENEDIDEIENEDIDEIESEYRKKYDEICYIISQTGFDELYNSSHIDSSITECITDLEGYNDVKLFHLTYNFEELYTKLNRINYFLSAAQSVKDEIY